MEIQAIDFASLRREERRKAREKRQKEKSEAELATQGECSKQSSESPETTDPNRLSLLYPTWNLPNLNHDRDLQAFDSTIHLLCEEPPFLYYIERFLQSHEFSAGLVSWLQALSERSDDRGRPNQQQLEQQQKPEKDEYQEAHGKWTRLRYAARRVALFDSRITPFPEPLNQLVQAIHDTVWQKISVSPSTDTIRPINHILINEYQATQGIMGHTDGPAYDPCTATLSLQSDAVLHFDAPQRPSRTVVLAANSLVLFTHQLYSDYQHSIANSQTSEALTTDCLNGAPGQVVHRGPLRYSLTFRHKRT